MADKVELKESELMAVESIFADMDSKLNQQTMSKFLSQTDLLREKKRIIEKAVRKLSVWL